jgi:hypothetical protein
MEDGGEGEAGADPHRDMNDRRASPGPEAKVDFRSPGCWSTWCRGGEVRT